jgi:hypothetical protein
MQRAQSDDEYRHAGLRSNPLIPNDQAVHAPKRLRAFLLYCFPKRMFFHQSTWVDFKLIFVNSIVFPSINVLWRLNADGVDGPLTAFVCHSTGCQDL